GPQTVRRHPARAGIRQHHPCEDHDTIPERDSSAPAQPRVAARALSNIGRCGLRYVMQPLHRCDGIAKMLRSADLERARRRPCEFISAPLICFSTFRMRPTTLTI